MLCVFTGQSATPTPWSGIKSMTKNIRIQSVSSQFNYMNYDQRVEPDGIYNRLSSAFLSKRGLGFNWKPQIFRLWSILDNSIPQVYQRQVYRVAWLDHGQLTGETGIQTPDIRVKDSALANMPLIFLSISLLISDLMHSMETVLKLGSWAQRFSM